MLDKQQLIQYKTELANLYRDKYSGKDTHKIIFFTSDNIDDFYIRYIPNHKSNDQDNDGSVNSILPVLIYATVSDSKVKELVCNQYTSIRHFSTHQSNLLIDNKVASASENVKLRHYLKTNLQVEISKKNGALEVKLNQKDSHPFLKAFKSIIQAVRFINNDGMNYTVGGSDARNDLLKELTQSQQAIKLATNNYRNIKNAHQHHRKSNKDNNLPKAHGKVVAGFSSTAGTPREIRYAKERKKRAKKAKYEREHPQKKVKQSGSVSKPKLSGKKVATTGRFSVALGKIKALLKQEGAIYQSNVNKDTDYVICNKPNKSKKYTNAKKLNIPFLSESELK